MLLRTLGGLALSGASFQRSKPLLLLAYLSLEGPKERRYLAELFWMAAANPRQSLSMALSQLRQGAPGAIESDAVRVWARVRCDAHGLLQASSRGHWQEVLQLARGPFLDGVESYGGSVELEEWVYGTREYLTARVQEALIALLEAAVGGEAREAILLAERAFAAVSGSSALDVDLVGRLHTALTRVGSPRAGIVRREAEAFGVGLPEIAPIETRPQAAEYRSGGPKWHNLPGITTTLVGREAELGETSALLSGEARLLTITGLGGMGKSRLAVALARDLLERGEFERAFFVPLESVRDPAEVAGRIASAIEAPVEEGGTPVDAVVSFVGHEKMLLVLDNFEHLIEVAGITSELLKACPRLRLLITSRAPLGVLEEFLYPLDGLTVPGNVGDALERTAYFDALRLFVERVRRTDPHFELSEDNAGAVVGIVRLLAGSPLGIELAAPLVSALPAEEVLAELSKSLDILEADARYARDCHSSLRAAFERSWKLLTGEQRSALRGLAVFREGFDRQAAAEVAYASMPVVGALLAKSLVRRSGRRYNVHPLVRGHAAEKLCEEPEVERAVRDRHAEYFAKFLGARTEAVGRAGERLPLREIGGDIDNAYEAWCWAVAQGRWDLGAVMLPVLERFHYTRGRHAKHLELVEEALQRLEPTKGLWSQLVFSRSRCQLALERYGEVIERGVRELEAHRRIGTPADLANASTWLGYALAMSGDTGGAQEWWRDALEVSHACGEETIEGRLLMNLAVTVADEPEALGLGQESIAIARRIGNPLDLVCRLRNHALHLIHHHGRFADAQAVASEAVEAARKDLDEGDLLAEALFCLARIERTWGRLDAAERAASEAEALLAGDLPRSRVELFQRELAHHRAHVLLLRDDPEAALAVADPILARSQDPEDQLLLGRTNLRLQRWDEAEERAMRASGSRRCMSVRDGIRREISMAMIAAEVGIARGRRVDALERLLRALDLAVEGTFTPYVLEGLLLTSALESDASARFLRETVASSPTAMYETRLRATCRLGGRARDRPALDSNGVLQLAREVRTSLQRLVAG